MPGPSSHVKHFVKANGNGRAIRIIGHDIRHMRPPFFHDRVFWQVVHRVMVRPFEIAKERVGLFIQMDRVVVDASLPQQDGKLWPYLIMAFLVFGLHAGIEKHFESVALHFTQPRLFAAFALATWRIEVSAKDLE